MKLSIEIDPSTLAEYMNSRIDIPYASETVEHQIYMAAIEAACKLLVDAVGDVAVGPVSVDIGE